MGWLGWMEGTMPAQQLMNRAMRRSSALVATMLPLRAQDVEFVKENPQHEYSLPD